MTLAINRPMLRFTILLALRFFIGFIFAYAGFSKLMSPPENFQAAMASYGIIPSFLLPGLARIVPWLEWLLGMFVLTGYNFRGSVLFLTLMSASFCVLIFASGQLMGAGSVDCGCFGEGGIHLSTRQMFFIDLFNTLSGFFLFRSPSMPLTIDGWLESKSD